MALSEGDFESAASTLRASIEHSDSWMTRFYLSKALASGGQNEAALVELQTCLERIGESTALYLDDIPTAQYHAPLFYWLGRTEQALGNNTSAVKHLEHYLSLRVAEDRSRATEDARDRLATLTTELQQAAL